MVKLRYGAVLWGSVPRVGITGLNLCSPSADSVLTRVVIIPGPLVREIDIGVAPETRNVYKWKTKDRVD